MHKLGSWTEAVIQHVHTLPSRTTRRSTDVKRLTSGPKVVRAVPNQVRNDLLSTTHDPKGAIVATMPPDHVPDDKMLTHDGTLSLSSKVLLGRQAIFADSCTQGCQALIICCNSHGGHHLL